MKQISMKKFKEMQVELKLSIKPLSVNAAWQGRRFKTKAYKQYAQELSYLLARYRGSGSRFSADKCYLEILYVFYLRNFANTDIDNLVKPLQDCMVKNGIIGDDRYIIKTTICKHRSKEDRIFIGIRKAEDLD